MEQVLQQFCLDGTPISCEPLGNGHINRTFRVVCDNRKAYTLQRINRVAFRHPEELIENIDAVSRFIDRKQIGLECIRLCRAKDGRKYCIDDQGEFWRAYNFISGGISLDMPRDRNDFYQAAVAFGKFQQALADFPAASLYETIPHFHDTIDRLRQFRAAIEADVCGRVKDVGPEIDFLLAREQELGTLCRMLAAGEDVKFIARRIVICASEDVGNADPMALPLAMAAAEAVQFVGMPEARITLAQAVTYIASAPKSNAAYLGIDAALKDVRTKDCGAVPKHLRDSHYKGAAALGHGQTYCYPHDYPGHFKEQAYLPDKIREAHYYEPTDIGREKVLHDYLRKCWPERF